MFTPQPRRMLELALGAAGVSFDAALESGQVVTVPSSDGNEPLYHLGLHSALSPEITNFLNLVGQGFQRMRVNETGGGHNPDIEMPQANPDESDGTDSDDLPILGPAFPKNPEILRINGASSLQSLVTPKDPPPLRAIILAVPAPVPIGVPNPVVPYPKPSWGRTEGNPKPKGPYLGGPYTPKPKPMPKGTPPTAMPESRGLPPAACKALFLPPYHGLTILFRQRYR